MKKALLVLVLGASLALADNPHRPSAPTCSDVDGAVTLTCSCEAPVTSCPASLTAAEVRAEVVAALQKLRLRSCRLQADGSVKCRSRGRLVYTP